MNPGDKEAENKFKKVTEAYEVLSDEGKRAQYDQFGHSAFENGGFGGAQDFGGFSDILICFSEAEASVRTIVDPPKGADLRYNLTIEFTEAAFGTEKTIEIPKWDDCNECQGTGAGRGPIPKPVQSVMAQVNLFQLSELLLVSFRQFVLVLNVKGKGKL